MTDATTQFFEHLAQRDHHPLLEHSSGSLRFDIADGKNADHWLGDPQLLGRFRRLFPGTPASKQRAASRSGSRR